MGYGKPTRHEPACVDERAFEGAGAPALTQLWLGAKCA